MTRAITDFEGSWQISRSIDDRFGGQKAAFEGTATLIPCQDGSWKWEESGYLTLGEDAPIKATRIYYWRPAPPQIEVFFEDGRPFHSFDPSGADTAAHWCDPDDYRAQYEFKDWPQWQAIWRVKGPLKDYEMISRYTRA
ncbi:hypothetical protein C8J27_106123 [Rhodobacter aestuarii]|uniref:DUF6314 domain-containing protein n=1 Tax=Rhodobacter aestuarii TaxID=453582 RepID=A0A1N7M5D8_9RHOB|nr:DUF6314 family protein [Rhodobacter aestuarii]PTV94855.1 hypothetical protein C8J27_106123 [Rhodobacter aestuarii]SIS81262.1 hypothetical protein SAMN05421580_105123 [Rhodobacter aestuarii]